MNMQKGAIAAMAIMAGLSGISATSLVMPTVALAETETGTVGTCPYTYDSATKTLTIGAGTLPRRNTNGYLSPLPHAKELKSIKFTGDVTLPADSSYMFAYCSGLTSLDLTHLKTDNVTNMNCIFSTCSGLTSLDLTPLNVSKVTNMCGMFAGCSSLTSLDLTPLKTDSVTDISTMFASCSSLTRLDLSPLNTDNVTDMGTMFWGCSGLTSLDLTPLKTDNVKYMWGMLDGCTSLTSLRTGNNFAVTAIKNHAVPTLPKAMIMDGITPVEKGANLVDGAHYYLVKDTALPAAWNTRVTYEQKFDFKDSAWSSDSDIHDGKVHLFYSTLGGKWQDPGQDVTVDTDNTDHDNGTYMLTIPTKIHYQNMNVGKVDTSDDYIVNVRGAIADGATVTVTAETGKVMSNGVESGITEITTQGKMSWTSQEAFGGLNQDGSLKGTDCTDNIKMSGEVKMSGQYEGSVKYEATLTNSTDSGSASVKKARTADEIAALQAKPTNIASGTWGTCPWWISSDGTLNIETGTGADPTYNSKIYKSAMPWYDYATQIKAFEGPSGGNKIVMPTNSSYMFYKCSGLTSLDLSSLKTENVQYMNSIFEGCSGLTSLDLTPLKTSKVTAMYGMFNGCYRLTNLDLTPLDTSSAMNMNNMFAGCSGLTSLDLTPLNTSNATNMGGMFLGCSGLTSLDLTPLKTDKVTNMKTMFYGCYGLKSLDLTPLNTSDVTDMAQMFYDCRSLTSLDLTPLKTDNVLYMGDMFEGCSGLTSLDLTPLKTDRVTDMSGMFEDCSGLTALDLTPLKTNNVTGMSSMFAGCKNLTSLDLTPLNTSNVTNMNNMFNRCSGIKSLDLTPLKTDKVISMYGMFWGCSGLKSLDLTPLKTDKVTNMSSMFDGCSSLTRLCTGYTFGIKVASYGKASLPKAMFMDGTTLMRKGTNLANGAHTYTAR